MRDLELHRRKQALDNAFARVGANVSPLAFELRADLARYLCIQVSGFIEVSVRHLFTAHVVGSTPAPTARFASARLGRLRTVDFAAIVELARAFDDGWAASLEASLGDEHRDAVNSIVANRHQIAHGNPTGVSLVRVQEYYNRVVEVVETLEDLVVPLRASA